MDPVIVWLRNTLPSEAGAVILQHIAWLEAGDFLAILSSAEARALFGKDEAEFHGSGSWNDYIFNRLASVLTGEAARQEILFSIGYAALLAFIQINVTGPPLQDVAVISQTSTEVIADIRRDLLASLTSDGIAAYPLIRNIELLCLADAILSSPGVLKNVEVARWARLRVNFMHQRILSEVSSTVQTLIYDGLKAVEGSISSQASIEFLLERAAIHIHHGLDKQARADIEKAGELHGFAYQLTGRLGKRTKFQQNDTSQLVVLAKSADLGEDQAGSTNGHSVSAKPTSLDLNDDTLLESISFTKPVPGTKEVTSKLSELDPSNQPKLHPLDSIVLLSMASAITNTSPEHGLTREEMLPYATRVLEGGSSNWQIYTQALLVRSRIEGYRSRTAERGLLQLQALVDQVIAETSDADSDQTSTFLPKPKKDESAPAGERLRYVFQLASPSRWSLEAELAARWVQLGGLRSALDIYERLEMWAEAALCFAATEQEDKARNIVRRQLFLPTQNKEENWEERNPPPPDAPRLYCILGDMDQSVEMFEKAWTLSGQRYARAQRSIGRHYFSHKEYAKSAEAYSKSLNVNQLHQPSWFALGCALIELEQYAKAAEAFSRCVQLDDTDAEAWSNMAAALLRSDEQANEQALRNRTNALKAFQRAAGLKHDSYRIWQNVLVTAASLAPPDYNAVLAAQKRLLDLRAAVDGEKCIDVDILVRLIQHVIEGADRYDPEVPGIARMTVRFVDDSIVPLITSSVELWHLVAKLAIWRGKLKTALDAEEKAWRAVSSQPGWENNESRWDEVVEATIRLCDAYESLGPREQTEGLAAGSGQVIAKDWKFKARNAARHIANRGKASWEDTPSWNRLREVQDNLKG